MQTLEVDVRVLLRTPGLDEKLIDSWEGPYVVLAWKGPVGCWD